MHIKKGCREEIPSAALFSFYHIPQQLLLRKYNLTISIKMHPLAEERLSLSAGLSILAQKCLYFLGGVYQHLKTTSVDDRYAVIDILTCRQDCVIFLSRIRTATPSRSTMQSKLSG